ncbi:hypothetical protein ASL20_09790 [Cupriavidus necator]|nr:hypothetical protein ASL20_09790 [Cupriavidus necator]
MRCKPGDLAFIAWDPFPENIGRVVRVVAPTRCATWSVRSECGPLRALALPSLTCTSSEGDCLDADLRLIGGVPVHEELPEELPA